MVDTPQTGHDAANPRHPDADPALLEARAWFVREVLPLESALVQFLHHSWRNRNDIADLRQEVYVRVYEVACKQIPHPAKPFVFAIARNLLIDRIRREHIIPIGAASDWETLNVTSDEPGPDRNVIARDELGRLQAALDRLPPRCREAVILGRIETLSRREIARRMGVSEATVTEHLTKGMRALANILYSEPADLRRKP
jgi:RNA polymerase sigma factor (sigma-70 family)